MTPRRVQQLTVALLAEGVDRNFAAMLLTSLVDVALLAEGVDRNRHIPGTIPIDNRSPSSRRAWIEICSKRGARRTARVALLAEGVDRNTEREDKVAERNCRPPRGGRG